ncbi:DUF29 domain-containing protein [Leptolyngbya sp. CCNP1308]|nr:DUF29 domain-containing protein [Leptolyngbya sp. CCNP1308]MEA5449026.1 DUF29 domain-containing protein [Leptolyngbya sp. CCNP1308]
MTAPQPIYSPPESATLYDSDYCRWLAETAGLLRSGRFDQIDVLNLAEELDDMGRSEKRAVESNLEVLLRHLLKYQYQRDRRSNSWRFTILEHRDGQRPAQRAIASPKPFATAPVCAPASSVSTLTATPPPAKRHRWKPGCPWKSFLRKHPFPLKQPSIQGFYPTDGQSSFCEGKYHSAPPTGCATMLNASI